MILRTKTFGSPKEIDTFITERGVTSSSRGRRRDVLPVGRQGLDASVVPRKAVNAAFNEDETELRISVLAVLVEVLPHRLGLLHEEVQNLRDGRSEALLLEDTQDLVASDHLYLWHTEAVPQRDTNGRGRHTLLRQLANLLAEIFRLQLDPARGPALVRECCEDMPLPGPYMRPMVGSPRSTPFKPRLELEMTRT